MPSASIKEIDSAFLQQSSKPKQAEKVWTMLSLWKTAGILQLSNKLLNITYNMSRAFRKVCHPSGDETLDLAKLLTSPVHITNLMGAIEIQFKTRARIRRRDAGNAVTAWVCRSFYNLEDTDHSNLNRFLSSLVERALFELETSYCLQLAEDGCTVEPQTLGRIASYYYLTHLTMRMFQSELGPQSTIPELIDVLTNASEYAELPVRHNEDQLNSELSKSVPLEVNPHTLDSPHTKANLLLQCHFGRLPLPSTDYNTDTKSVLDQAIRICQAMLDVSADQGWLVTSLGIVTLVQMLVQGRWWTDNTLLTLPHLTPYHTHCFRSRAKGALLETLPEVMETCEGRYPALADMLKGELDTNHIEQVYAVLCKLPQIEVTFTLQGYWEGGDGCQEKRHIDTPLQGSRLQDQKWMSVHADQEYVLNVTLARINKNKKTDSKANAPRFPKPKDEGWFLIVGDVQNRDLVALKRVPFVRGRSSVQVSVFTPETPGRVIYTVYLMSDSYLGLDQQYDIHVDVTTPCIEAQVNTELAAELNDLDFDS
ncbi:ASCC3-like protein [Mya arenaria]|uniref:ASCC3-like protein n=1 Tax=Mya arenaria TaxID=6604 RepID=A0ABY7EFY8_MYAAR|nr:ASCC3-like protein [Mya arenaria]